MKAIGLIGGMSWESSLQYYRLINEATKQRLGGLHSARCVMYSVDFAEIEEYQRSDRWDDAARALAIAARRVEAAGADFLVLCTNTMHRVAGEIEAAVRIPLLHIADATAEVIRAADLSTIGLLGTRYTMEQEFYRGRFVDKHGLNVLTPDEPDRTTVHNVIYQELVLGTIYPESKEAYRRIINDLISKGAEGVILGCTEIPLLITQDDVPVPVFDTTRIHAEQAVERALA